MRQAPSTLCNHMLLAPVCSPNVACAARPSIVVHSHIRMSGSMTQKLDRAAIAADSNRLNTHPLYAKVRSIDDLRAFMSQHVYSVWDFMSLLKTLQMQLAPVQVPWRPTGSAAVRHFINEIVSSEESDEGPSFAGGGRTYASHFELYCDAMREVGADPVGVIRFSNVAASRGVDTALALDVVPGPARRFVRTTFDFIETGKPHVVAAAFAFGREHIIPEMFRALLAKMNVAETLAPMFHYYLARHIDLDGAHHGPLALQMVDELVGSDPVKIQEAQEAAHAAIAARILFWDDVLAALT